MKRVGVHSVLRDVPRHDSDERGLTIPISRRPRFVHPSRAIALCLASETAGGLPAREKNSRVSLLALSVSGGGRYAASESALDSVPDRRSCCPSNPYAVTSSITATTRTLHACTAELAAVSCSMRVATVT